MSITVINDNDKYEVNVKKVRDVIALVLKGEKHPKAEVSIKFCDNNYMQKLNKQYFNRNNPTDVISFPAEESKYLGDILVSSEMAEQRAPEFDNSFQEELILYIIHGVLHLVGFNDINPFERELMQEKEEYYLGEIKDKKDVIINSR